MNQWLKRTVCAFEYKNKKTRNIQRLFLPSFLGIALCMAGLVGTTWAWFSASIQTKPQTIQAAKYETSVTVNDTAVTGSKELLAGNSYTVRITASGTADTYGGYCMIEGGEKPLYTGQIAPGKTLEFTWIPNVTAVYTFTAVWGEYQGIPDFIDGGTVGQNADSEMIEQTQPEAEEQKPSDSVEQESQPENSTDTPDAEENQNQPKPQEDTEGSEREDNSSSGQSKPAEQKEEQEYMSSADLMPEQ